MKRKVNAKSREVDDCAKIYKSIFSVTAQRLVCLQKQFHLDFYSFGYLEKLSLNTKQVVVVTSELPGNIYDNPERAKEFATQIEKTKEHKITVAKVKVEENK